MMSIFFRRDKHEMAQVEAATAKALTASNTPRGYRVETSYRVYDDKTMTTNAPSTAIPDLIMMDPQDKYNYALQEIVAREDPIAKFVTVNIPENVFDEGFIFVQKGTEDEHPLNAAFQVEFMRCDGKNVMTRWLIAVRKHGHAWLDIIPEELAEDMRIDEYGNELQPRIAKMDFYSPRHVEVVNWTKTGVPKELKIEITLPNGSHTYIEGLDASEMIFYRNGEFGDRSYRGVSELTGIWDALTYIRQVLFSMGWYAIKVGIGVFYVKIRGAVTPEKKAAAEAMLTGVSQKRGIIYSEMIIDELGFIQADSGSTAFPEYVDTLLSQISIATGVPKTILAGLAMSSGGSEAAMDLRVGVINTCQKRLEYVIREMALRFGFDFSDADILWPTRYATSEEQEAKIYMSNTQADVVSLDYKTINEVRAMRGMEPIEGGDELMALKMANSLQQGGQSIDQQEQTRNDGGQQV
jgi:hypothetical protein